MPSSDRTIICDIEVPASLHEVWSAWTTEAGAISFFAPACHIDVRPGGAYEMYFNPDADPGVRGGEGMIVLAAQPESMLSFTWNAPPHLPQVRKQMTHVTVRLEPIDERTTHVQLQHDGWGSGGEWDQAHAYFMRAWGQVVLPRLKYRFEHGPIDWHNLPDLA